MKNRRNYYRILHVQPDAPTEIIKSSYRSLMLHMEMHPDRGGEHWSAALINEAYTTLSDPERRKAYDRTIDLEAARRGCRPAPRDTSPQQPPPAGPATLDECCVFCGLETQGGRTASADASCARCHSPLQLADRSIWDASGRRAATRLERDGRIVYFTDWPQRSGAQATICDLSPTGIGISGGEALPRYLIVKLEGTLVEAIARVVRTTEHAGRADGRYSIGLEFFTVRFPNRSGTFLSVQA